MIYRDDLVKIDYYSYQLVTLESKDSFNSGYWQNYMRSIRDFFLNIFISVMMNEFSSLTIFTFLNLMENGRYKKKR